MKPVTWDSVDPYTRAKVIKAAREWRMSLIKKTRKPLVVMIAATSSLCSERK